MINKFHEEIINNFKKKSDYGDRTINNISDNPIKKNRSILCFRSINNSKRRCSNIITLVI